jgi:hypothetical protein
MNKYLFETDFSEDSLRWIKIVDGKNLKIHKSKIDKTSHIEELEKIQNEIIQSNDSALAYFCACDFPYKTYRMQKVVLDKKDPKYAFLFAQNIPGCDVKALQNVVVLSKKTKYISKFACFVKDADVAALEQLILKSKNVKYCHMYVKHVNGADINKFKKIILNSKKPRYLYALAKHTTSLTELSLIEDLLIEVKSFTYMRMMAEKIKNANVDKLEQAILDSENSKEIKKFAKYVKKSKMKRFLLVG